MCCIFTCCGWVLDLIQRIWTFAMSCCISTAVCCALLIASMSGIALGYNYSLAEYIDLKETNVSVFLKRGVFDDEVVDDMEWRRSGPHQNLAGALGDNHGNMITPGMADDEMPMRRSGAKPERKLDDAIFQDDHHRFEGSLMKLTQKPVYTITQSTTTAEMFTGAARAPIGSLDELKEIQTIINRRKAEQLQRSTERGETTPPQGIYEKDPGALANYPHPAPMGIDGRRMMMTPKPPWAQGSIRDAVPGYIHPKMWVNSQLPPDQRLKLGDRSDAVRPGPATPNAAPLRPYTFPEIAMRTGYEHTYPPPPRTSPRTTTTADLPKFPLDVLPEEERDVGNDNHFTNKPGGIIEEYEEDIKGLPVRKRRHVHPSPSNLLYSIITNTPEAAGTVTEPSLSDRKSLIRNKFTKGIHTKPLLEILKQSYEVVLLDKEQ